MAGSYLSNIQQSNQRRVLAPSWMLWTQCICFALLYAIWDLPETILLRHVCLMVGASLSLFEIVQARHELMSRRVLPACLILGLFLWMTFHLFFIGQEFNLQLTEYTSIWKRTIIGSVFAFGFGITLAKNQLSKISNKKYFSLMYAGLMAPSVIYIIKYALTFHGESWGISKIESLHHIYEILLMYVPKTSYVCFSLPTLSVALGLLGLNIQANRFLCWSNLAYVSTLPLVLFVFFGENVKNGVAYSLLIVLFFSGLLFLKDWRRNWIRKLLFLTAILGIASVFLMNNLQNNNSWATFVSDAKIAMQIDQYQQWKYNGAKGYPNNELGQMVSITNYERTAWAINGLLLIKEYPLGYGLVERSFGHIGKIKWPDSKLHQSHSGWIDLTLGIGIPGILLVIGALLLAMRQLGDSSIYNTMAWWILLASLLMWCTTEISQKVFFDDLIFWISFAGGLGLILQPSWTDGNDPT